MNARCREGRTPLHLACEAGHLSIVRHLLGHASDESWDLEAVDDWGRTPLALARGRHTAVCELILAVKKRREENRSRRSEAFLEFMDNPSLDAPGMRDHIHSTSPHFLSANSLRAAFEASGNEVLYMTESEDQKSRTIDREIASAARLPRSGVSRRHTWFVLLLALLLLRRRSLFSNRWMCVCTH